jgi:DNA-binding beta-propeller fold protein YncE
VALREPARIALVSVPSGAIRDRVDLPGAARHLRLAAPGGPVLVPAEPAGRLARVALPGGAVSSVAVGDRPHDATSAAGRDFVAGEGVRVLEGGREVGRLRTALEPGGIATADRGRTIAVLSVRGRRLELFDAATFRRVGTAAAGTGPTHIVSDGANRLYVADTKAGALLVFRTVPELRLTRRYPLAGSPYGLAFDSERGRIWATLTTTNEVVELSAGARPRALRRFPSVRQPNSVAVEPRSGRVLVAGRADGVLQLLDPPPLPRRK